MLKKILLFLVLFPVSFVIAMEQDAKRSKIHNPLEDSSESFEMAEPWQQDLDIEQPLPFGQPKEEQVTISTQDGKDFKVSVRLAKLSETIKNLIEDAGTQDPIPLPTINAQTWKLIQSLLEWVDTIRLKNDHKDNSQDDTREDAKNNIIIVLQELKGTELVDFIMAVNYLDISPLLNIIIDVVKQSNVSILSPAHIAQLPKDIRNPIILAHSVKALAPFQGQQLHIQKGFKSAINTLCVSPDGSKVFSAHMNGMMRCWDINTGVQLSQFGQVTWGNVKLCLMPDSAKAVIGFWGKPMRLWDLVTNQEITESMQLECPDDINLNIRSMQVTPDGTKLVASLLNSTIVWDIKMGKILTHYQNEDRFCSFCITPDSSQIVFCSQSGVIRIYDSTTGEKLVEFPGHGRFTHSVMVTPDSKKIVLQCADKVISVRDFTIGTVLNEITFEVVIRSMCITPDGSMMVLGLMNGALSVCDIDTGKEIIRFEGHKVPVSELSVTSNGSRLISAAEDNTLRIWNLALLKPLLAMTAEQAYHIWNCLQKNDLVQCREYVQAIIAGPNPVEPHIQNGKARKPSPKRHKAHE